MKLLLRSLLLMSLCAGSCWSVSSNTLGVIQTPDVSVMEGDTVIITCCWRQKLERVRVNWLKKETIIKKEDWWTKSQGSLKKDTNNCSSLSFPNITRDDSGRYICSVSWEIPVLASAKGNGTLITVMGSDDHNDDDAPLAEVYIYILRCVPILFLVTPLCCLFFYLRTKAQQNTPASTRKNPTWIQRSEEDDDEGEGDERVIQAAGD